MRNTFLDQKENKTTLMKKRILRLCVTHGEYSIAALASELKNSVPTVTKLIYELIDEGFMVDLGKHGTSGGRRPSIYGLNPDAGYFAGVDIRHSHASIVVTDFKGSLVAFEDDFPFVFTNTETAVLDVGHTIRSFFERQKIDWDSCLGVGLSITGRVNPHTGESYSYPFPAGMTIQNILQDELGVPVTVENDSRAMTYGEYLSGIVKKERNVLFVNISWGLGMGMILDGNLFYGKSGFSGEIGHVPLLDNDIICRCGKVGCLETGASGSALHRMVIEGIKSGRNSSLSGKYRRGEKITINDIYKAIGEEDVLAIEKVGEVGDTLGRGIAGMINLFNPELVVIGGKMAVTGDYLMLPIRQAVKRCAQNFVARDTSIKFSKLGLEAAPVGAAMLSRSKLLGIL